MGKKDEQKAKKASAFTKPADAAYKAEMRWLKNKRLSIERQKKREARQKERVEARFWAGQALSAKRVRKIAKRYGTDKLGTMDAALLAYYARRVSPTVPGFTSGE